jgi:hypothetical protein
VTAANSVLWAAVALSNAATMAAIPTDGVFTPDSAVARSGIYVNTRFMYFAHTHPAAPGPCAASGPLFSAQKPRGKVPTVTDLSPEFRTLQPVFP